MDSSAREPRRSCAIMLRGLLALNDNTRSHRDARAHPPPHAVQGQAALWREALRCVCAAGVVHPGGAAAERLLPVLAAARQPLPASWLPDIAGCSGPEAQALVAALGGLLAEHEGRLLWRDHTLLTVWQVRGRSPICLRTKVLSVG